MKFVCLNGNTENALSLERSDVETTSVSRRKEICTNRRNIDGEHSIPYCLSHSYCLQILLVQQAEQARLNTPSEITELDIIQSNPLLLMYFFMVSDSSSSVGYSRVCQPNIKYIQI
jgi:hypothetical protein